MSTMQLYQIKLNIVMYIERLFAPHWGWIGALFYAQSHGQIQEEVFYLSKPVYAADKPNDCHYCYF